MKTTRTVSILFSLLGVLLLIGGLLLCWFCAGSSPLLLHPSENAVTLTETFMESLRSGDPEAAGSMLLGQPRLSFEPFAESSIAALMWDAYTDSLQFTFQDGLSPCESGCCRKVTVTGLDLPALIQKLKAEIPSLLARAASSRSNREVFDASGYYRQDFILDVLFQKIQSIPSGQYPTATREYQLELVLQAGDWKIRPNQDILNLICGKIA